jgi:dipeptidase E
MNKNRSVIAIGGGGSVNNVSIYKNAVALIGKKKPHALLIPTAAPGRDPANIWATFQECFGNQLNCHVNILDLLFRNYTSAEIEKLILGADLIYVSGGNTLRMVTVLKNKGVDSLLIKAYQKGTVLMGESAGAICWHEFGHSDSRRERHPENWNYICVAGFGYFPGLFCPHYTRERGLDFEAMLLRKKKIGLALTDFAAIQYQNDQYRIVRSKRSGSGYLFHILKGRVVRKKLAVDGIFRPIKSLLIF